MSNNPDLRVSSACECHSQYLKEKMEEINRIYFDFTELPEIRWSRGSVKKKYRRIIFGTYDLKKVQIRIHPILKDPQIPDYVLDFVIYHELLHFEDFYLKKASHLRQSGFRIHDSDFHGREKEFPLKEEASRFMKDIANGDFQKRELRN